MVAIMVQNLITLHKHNKTSRVNAMYTVDFQLMSQQKVSSNEKVGHQDNTSRWNDFLAM